MSVMRRTSPLIALVLALAGAAPAAAAGFGSGVAAGEITSTSALLWTRAPRGGLVRVVVIDRDARIPTGKFRQVRARGRGRVVRVTIRGLRPGHHQVFRFIQGSQVSSEGQFETAPRTSSNRRVQFVVHGGATTDARPRTNDDGDLPGSDFRIDLGATGAATTGSEQRRVAATRALRGATGGYYLWNGDGAGRGRSAFLQRNPAATGKLGLFRHVRWGRNVDLFLLDERSFRSAGAQAACPGLGGSDQAPTMPDINRLTSLIPSLANPVAAACRATIASPGRHLLGEAQYAALLRALKASRTRFHVIVSPVPLGQYYVDPYDRAEGFASDRLRLLDALREPANGLRNVVVLSGAAGGTLVSEVRLHTLDSPAVGTGVREFATGRSRDGLLATQPSAATWRLILHRPLPNGVGVDCTALGTTSFLHVTVTTKALTVTLRDGHRKPVLDDVTRQPCGTVVIPFTP